VTVENNGSQVGRESPNVSVDQIGTTPLPRVPEEPVALHQDPLTGQTGFREELGWVGKFIGGKSEKAGNVAFIVIVVCFVLLMIVTAGWVVHSGTEEYKAGAAFAPLMSVISGALGFMFGKGSDKKGD